MRHITEAIMIGGKIFTPGKRDKARQIPMRDVAKLTPDQLKRRQSFLEHGFEMFSSRSIEAIYLPDVAKASGHGIATLYRYFSTKAEFALAIAEWKWGEFFRENRKRSPIHNLEDKTAADMLDFYLESFLELYRKHKALQAERKRVTIPFSPRAYIRSYTKRNDNAGAVCPAGSLRFFA